MPPGRRQVHTQLHMHTHTATASHTRTATRARTHTPMLLPHPTRPLLPKERPPTAQRKAHPAAPKARGDGPHPHALDGLPEVAVLRLAQDGRLPEVQHRLRGVCYV